jgi:hypothetical protein
MRVSGKEKIYAAVLCILFSFAVLYECSQASPRFPLSTWVDPHCYFTIGKALLKGRVLYRDIYDIKGPLLYLLYAPASLISYRTLTGVYVLESVTGAAALYFVWRYFRDCLRTAALPLTFAAGMLLFFLEPFSAGGSAEEHSLPVLAYCFWKFSASVRTDVPLKKKDWFLIGILAAVVFWSKYSVCFLIAGSAIMPLILTFRKKGRSVFTEAFVPGFLGVLSVSLPVLFYFAAVHALPDLFHAYFYSNLFQYSLHVTDAGNYNAFTLFGYYAAGYLLFLALGILAPLFSKSYRTALHIFFTAAVSFIPLIRLGDPYNYYYLPFWIVTLPGFMAVGEVAEKLLRKAAHGSRLPAFILTAAVFVSGLAAGFSGGRNRAYLHTPKDYYPQFKFAEIINSVPDSVLLQFNLYDVGFYTAAGKECPVKYVTETMRDLPGLFNEQMEFINSMGPDFIVAGSPDFIFPGYELIDVRICNQYVYRGTFALFERKTLRK